MTFSCLRKIPGVNIGISCRERFPAMPRSAAEVSVPMWGMATGRCTPWPAQCYGSAGRKQLISTNTTKLARPGSHDQAGMAERCRRIFSAARGVGRDRLGLLIGLRDRLAGIPSECDPELSTTSTVQMLPSGWIKRCSNPTFVPCKGIIPCNRRQGFCCAGKIDCASAPGGNIRDA